MTEEHEFSERLDAFLEERNKFNIPSGELPRVKLLAKELAKGYDEGLWEYVGRWVGAGSPHESNTCVRLYFLQRWRVWDFHDSMARLRRHRYTAKDGIYESLTQSAYDLLNESEPYNVFISYRRLDSSALALLVLARLKEHSLVPFLDMALEAGGNWHADLEERIKACDYFIILLGKDTLSSPMTVKEIQWALKYERSIIPIWHSGFNISDEKWNDVPSAVMDVIQQTNAIIVQDESASGYNTAIVELLNRFGVTP